jgi:hypothetical protein
LMILFVKTLYNLESLNKSHNNNAILR